MFMCPFLVLLKKFLAISLAIQKSPAIAVAMTWCTQAERCEGVVLEQVPKRLQENAEVMSAVVPHLRQGLRCSL